MSTTIFVKEVRDEDFTNYQKPSMFIGFPRCSWKCEKECGMRVCQNSTLAEAKNIEIEVDTLINRYLNNPITKAVVCGGLEPFDSWRNLIDLVSLLRSQTTDDIVIYTGYKEEEIKNQVQYLRTYRNIVIKFGRFIPNQQKHFDETLGVYLAGDNQYAKRIS